MRGFKFNFIIWISSFVIAVSSKHENFNVGSSVPPPTPETNLETIIPVPINFENLNAEASYLQPYQPDYFERAEVEDDESSGEESVEASEKQQDAETVQLIASEKQQDAEAVLLISPSRSTIETSAAPSAASSEATENIEATQSKTETQAELPRELAPPTDAVLAWTNNVTAALQELKNLTEITENLLSDNATIAAEGTGHYNSYSHPHSSYGHQNHYHEPSYVKPLKESHVHRNPYDSFDHYDVIRTQDYDRQPHGHGHGKSVVSTHGHGHGHGHSNAHGGGYGNFQPYHYDPHKIPECAHQNHYHYNITFCLEDHYYPTETILWAIQKSGHYAQQLLSDVTYQSADNLVDGLTRVEEEGYTYSHYYGASHSQHNRLDKYRPPYTGYSYNSEYYKNGGYICPSDIYYSRPRRAMNTYGKWKVLVNVDTPKHGHGNGHKHSHGHGHSKHYTQTLRLEQCIYPNAPCSYIDSHYYSRCLQKHNFIRLVAWTYEEGLHVDTFKLPVACSCHIQQPAHYYSPPPKHTAVIHGHGHSGGHGHGQTYGHGHSSSYTHSTNTKHGAILNGIQGLHHGKANVINSLLGITNH